MKPETCKVWIRGNLRCSFGRSIFDNALNRPLMDGSHRRNQSGDHYDVMAVKVTQHNTVPNAISIWTSPRGGYTTDAASNAKVVPFGRSKLCPTLSVETREVTRQKSELQQHSSFDEKTYVKLAVVGMVHDTNRQRVLITRRPRYMRSFPGAYVFPGGGINDNDESIVKAVSREVREETGLDIENWHLESLWESVYPPDVSVPAVPILAHHLVCFYSGYLPEDREISLNLCNEEVEDALWLTRSDTETIISSGNILAKGPMSYDPLPHLRDLVGIYPQPSSSGEWSGIAQGSLFALEQFAMKSWGL